MPWLLLILALASASLSAQAVDPLALVRRAVALEQEESDRELSFAYRERVVSKDFDGSGKVTERAEKVHDVLMIEGSPERILLEEAGMAVPPEQMRSQQEYVRRVVEIRKAESEAKRRERIEKFEKKRREFLDAVVEIPEAFTFRLLREESVDGRPSYVLAATPRAGYEPHNRYGKIFTQTEGTLWIDKQTGRWRRAEGKLRETVNLGWIFVQMRKETSAIVEQKPFAGAGWMMSRLWYRTALRVGFFVHYRLEQDARYWNYQRMTPQLLTEVLTPGYQPELQPPAQ